MPRPFGALVGIVAGGVAVTISMLVAAITEVVSPVDAVGSEVIDRTPGTVKKWAIEQFATNDKFVLRLGIVVILAIAAVTFGALAIRRPWLGVAGIIDFGIVGAAASVHRPAEGIGSAVPSILGAIVGAVLLYRLVRPRPIPMPGESQVPLGWDRRRFFVFTGSAAAGAVVAGGIAKAIEDNRVDKIREATNVPLPPTDTGVEVPPGAELFDKTPFITPNEDFYRIDTALSFPRVNVDTWSFEITGMVDHPVSFTRADLLAMPQVDRVVTLCCVSNEVGGDLVGNAVWRGVLLRDLLDKAGVHADAQQVYCTSLDGFTCGFPVKAALDGRDAMVAFGMNGKALPLEHGFPARLVVPGLYGYVSACKWLAKIELTTWDKEGYWVPLGWAREGPVKTQSRIDVPGPGALTAGKQVIAGVAWAQHRGIDKVEVQIGENAPWQNTRLGADVSDDAWRQWLFEWDAKPGQYRVAVRATDKTGYTQTAEYSPPDPDGATGYDVQWITIVP